MGKKKLLEKIEEKIEETAQQVETKTSLTPEQYWEWRSTIAELEIAKKAHDIANLQVASAKKDNEILALKAQVFSLTSLKTAEKAVREAQEDYTNTKNRLEGLLGISLNGKIIDALTLEVKDAPQD